MIRSCFYTYPYHLRCSCLKIKALCHLYLKMAKDSSFASMKTKLLPILRYIVLALLLLCIVLCRFPSWPKVCLSYLSVAVGGVVRYSFCFPFFLRGGAGGCNHFMDDYLSFS